MLSFLSQYWSDLLLSIVGLSAIMVYYIQKRDACLVAGTLIVGQITLIEKSIISLKEDPQLGGISVFYSKPIIKDNMWEKYKHLFVKTLTSSEYEYVQKFFDHAEQLERARADIVLTITTAWKDKSNAENNVIAQMIRDGVSDKEITSFAQKFASFETNFTPNVTINHLTMGLQNYYPLTGTSAYSKIQKNSYTR